MANTDTPKKETILPDNGCCSTCAGDMAACPDERKNRGWLPYLPPALSFILLAAGLLADTIPNLSFFTGKIRLIWYIIAYIPVAYPVIVGAARHIAKKDIFNEFTLMSVATLGAFLIGEYPEAVGVMLFYSVGELFQDAAVNRSKRHIKALLDVRPDTATVLRDGEYRSVKPESVGIGEILQVKAGEKIPLDGMLLSSAGSFNTSALTGESVPRTIRKGAQVLAGMINLNTVIEVKVEKSYSDSSLSRILEMVQNASARKAKTELLIRRFARVYTPVVFFLALAVLIIPYFVVQEYVFTQWLYRALVFLVISCPCALVVSVPLGYFGGIGAASRKGILFKGANYLDLMTKVNTVVMDKTGTLTQGVFRVQETVCVTGNPEQMTGYAAALERNSNHPIARAIVEYGGGETYTVENIEEIAGYGLKGCVDGHEVLVGNGKLLHRYNIDYDRSADAWVETVVMVAIDGRYAGAIIIADRIKEDSVPAVQELKREGIRTVMLSGDKTSIVRKTAGELQVDEAYGDLLPQDKVAQVAKLKENPSNVVAFVGDGINDAPVLALSDVGIAMGGMGAEAAIEVADVVIQTDQPSKIATAIKIARSTRRIVIQNIVLALGVKGIVMLLGALGIANLWEAVFADVGVALLAILNSVRILNKKW